MYRLSDYEMVRDYSLKSNTSTVDFSGCKLNKKYSSDDIFINKFDMKHYNDSLTPMNVTYSIISDIINFNKIFKDCSKTVTVPFPNINIDTDKVLKFQNQGINLLDRSDPFFNDRCLIYEDENKRDYSINERRKELFLGIEVSCTKGCTFIGIDKYRNVICNCNDISSTLSINIYNYSFPQESRLINPDIVICIKQIIMKVNFY